MENPLSLTHIKYKKYIISNQVKDGHDIHQGNCLATTIVLNSSASKPPYHLAHAIALPSIC